MKKLLFILMPLIFCALLLSCAQREKAGTENFIYVLEEGEATEEGFAENELEENGLTRDELTEDVRGLECEGILDSLTGYYARYIKLQDNERIFIDFFIYEEEKQYYGYLNILKYDRENNCFRGRMLTEVCQGQDTIVCVKYFYREDGTLERKECYFNDRVFGTTRCSEKYYYDEQERLKYVSAYITHGTLRDYYIYEGESLEPAYCLGVDFTGASASEYRFIKYDGE